MKKSYRILVPLLFMAAVFFMATSSAIAVTRTEACNKEQYSESQKQDCLKQLDVETFNNCIGKPDPGKCAEEYKNAEVPTVTAEQIKDTGAKGDTCGGDVNGVSYDQVKTIINIGCRGKGNAIVDLTFAIIRVLSVGVGIVVVGSIMVAGIQYITSAGNPANTAKALERIQNTVIALVLYLVIFALLNWIIPAGVF